MSESHSEDGPSEALKRAANVLYGYATNEEAFAALRDLCVQTTVDSSNLALGLDEC